VGARYGDTRDDFVAIGQNLVEVKRNVREGGAHQGPGTLCDLDRFLAFSTGKTPVLVVAGRPESQRRARDRRG
jgi:hypothetical protein